MRNPLIREPTAGDVDEMARVLHEGILTAAERLGGYRREHLRCRPIEIDYERIASILTNQSDRAIVACRPNEPATVLGLVTWDVTLPDARIGMLYVDPPAQGYGVGSLLLSRAVQESNRAGAATIRVTTMQWNSSSRAFYQYKGFRPSGQTSYVELLGTRSEAGQPIAYPNMEYILRTSPAS